MVKEILKNGAIVIRRSKDVVLCTWRDEFVTWRTDDEGNAYWGHYFTNNFALAVTDFAERTRTH